MFFYELAYSIVIVIISCYIAGYFFDFFKAVTHCNSVSCHADKTFVVHAVAKAHDLCFLQHFHAADVFFELALHGNDFADGLQEVGGNHGDLVDVGHRYIPAQQLRHGEDGAGDQLLQLILGDADGVAGADVGQVGVFVGGFGADGEGSVAGADGDLEVVVHHHGDGAFGQAADDVAEELGQDAFAAVADIGIDVIGDGGFHIVAGEGQTGTRPAEDTLDGAEGALLGHRPGGNVQSLKEGIFFTGKTHGGSPSFVR